jgi:hypothetical protein
VPVTAEPIQTTLDYPVDEDGVFTLNADPQWWPLRLNWRWEAGSGREAEALERWRLTVDRARWEEAGRPWSRSAWEASAKPWHDAAAVRDARRESWSEDR